MDFSITCRTCLLVDDGGNMQSIYDCVDDQELASMIEACSKTKVNRHDGLPAQICRSCSTELQDCIKFRRKCETSYKTLQEVHFVQSPEEHRKHLWSSSPERSQKEFTVRPRKPKPSPVVYHKFKTRELFEMDDNEKGCQTDEVAFFSCEMCEMKFVSEDALKLHRVVHEDSGFQCTECTVMFAKRTHLRRHVATAHPDAAGKKGKNFEIVCKLCDKKFARTDNLHRHMLKHTGNVHVKQEHDDDFECDKCELVFRNALELKAHGKCPGKAALELDARRPRRIVKPVKRLVEEDEESESESDEPNPTEEYLLDECDSFQSKPPAVVVSEESSDKTLEILDEIPDTGFNVDEEFPEGMVSEANAEEYQFHETLDDDFIEYDPVETPVATPVPFKRGPGRPRLHETETPTEIDPIEEEAKKRGPGAQTPSEIDPIEEAVVTPVPVKRGRGRPRLHEAQTPHEIIITPVTVVTPRKRGRPRKDATATTASVEKSKTPSKKPKNDDDKDYEEEEEEVDEDDEDIPNPKVTKEVVTFKCKHCPKTFTRYNHLRRHVIIHSNIKPFACEVCGKRFTRMDHLAIHKHHHSAVKPFNCEVCQRGFTRLSHLQKHMECRHNEDRKLKSQICPICNKGFNTPNYLQVHMKMHQDKEFICKFCSERFATKAELVEHTNTKIHANERPYLCSECGASFVRNDYLTVHMRRHKGFKPYKCKYCDKAFPRSTDLTVHERYHTGERTHMCTVCGKGFQRAYNLVVHMRIHTGEKPYDCPHCDKKFAQANDMKSHVRRHTGERFKCDLCDEGFIQGYNLTQHQRKVHGLNVESHIKRVEKFIPSKVDVDEADAFANAIIHEEVETLEVEVGTVKREVSITVGDNQTAIIEYHI